MARTGRHAALMLFVGSCVKLGEPQYAVVAREPVIVESPSVPLEAARIVAATWRDADLRVQLSSQPMCETRASKITEKSRVTRRARHPTTFFDAFVGVTGFVSLLGAASFVASFQSKKPDESDPAELRAPGLVMFAIGIPGYTYLLLRARGEEREEEAMRADADELPRERIKCGAPTPIGGAAIDIDLRKGVLVVQHRVAFTDDAGVAAVGFAGAGAAKMACGQLELTITDGAGEVGYRETLATGWFDARTTPPFDRAPRLAVRDLQLGCCAATSAPSYADSCRAACVREVGADSCFQADATCRSIANRQQERETAVEMCVRFLDECLATRRTTRAGLDSCGARCAMRIARGACERQLEEQP